MTFEELEKEHREALFNYLLYLGDDRLILGHRLSEWCGHGPILEEDIALANIALDCIGQASNFLKLAGEVEGTGRSEDDLAYHREAIDFKNIIMVELPKGDFAFTIARQFLFSAYSHLLFEQLQHTNIEELSALSSKCAKEVRYHLRHTSEWMLRLGDGTEESHQRTQNALNDVWMYTGEMFEENQVEKRLFEKGKSNESTQIWNEWKKIVAKAISKATLDMPEDGYMMSGGRSGRHSEHLGHLLAEMQILPRSFPEAKW
ncbi:MAG: phenylacetic acid degradation protein [Desulfobacterales bacterium SG8_35_2]|nr:MAG: phenylacetic acid degradation protein [Desulfobacterales bacterium SG8_35_2]